MLFNTLLVIVLSVSGEYYCEAENGTETDITPPNGLDVQYPPKSVSVSVSPSGEIVEGSAVTLTCMNNANPPVQKYTWYKNRAELSWRGSIYTIKSITLQNAGEYYCAAQNVIGTEQSPPKRLDVQYPPKRISVSVSPSGEIVEGSSVTLTCMNNANPPVQKYTWYKNRAKLSWTGSSYTIKSITLQDAEEYYCAAQNVIGTNTSPLIRLDVQYPPKSVSVSVSPSDEIMEGSSVTLTCISDGNPPVQRYTWYKNNRAVSPWGGSRYTIKTTTLQDAGEYYCEAGNGVGTNRSPPKRLDVQYPPKSISVSVSPSGEIVEGSSVSLTCSSYANPPVQRYTWYKNNRAVSSWRASERRYTINKINSGDAGEYYCEPGNEIGTKTSPPKRLDVKYRPKSVSVSVSPSGEIVEGSSVTLTCSSDADPPVQKYTWYKKTGFAFSRRGSEQSYTINEIKSGDAGEYYCEAGNAIGTNRSSSERLDVQYRPKSVSVSVRPSGEIVEGSSVTLTCSSDANPPVQNYTWFKKNETVWQAGSVQSLNFSNFTPWNRGQYYCEARNKHGGQNSTAVSINTEGTHPPPGDQDKAGTHPPPGDQDKAGGQSLIVAAAVGVAEILALVFLGVCLRRRKSTNETEGDRQGNKSPIDGNFSEMAMSHTGTQGHQPHP